MGRDEDRAPKPIGDDDTVIDLQVPVALDDDATVLDDAAAMRDRGVGSAEEEVTATEDPPRAAPQPMVDHEASTVVAQPPIDNEDPTLTVRARVGRTQPASPPTSSEASSDQKRPRDARHPSATGKKARAPAPQPMTFGERTGITKLITAAMSKSERRRRIAVVASLALLMLLIVVLLKVLPSTATHARLTGWLDALPTLAQPEPEYPSAERDDVSEAPPRRGREEGRDMIDKRYDRRRARDLIDGPANALDALSGSPRSRKLGSEFDAASSRLRPGASGKRVAQPMKSRGADDTGARTLGIGSLGNQRAGRDAMDDQISYPPHEDVRLDDAAVRVISTGRVVALDGLSQVTAQAVFKRAEVQFRYCYEAAIERNPNARGRVKLSVDVSLSGAVDGAAIEESGLRDSRAEACILRVAERLRFPRSSNESQVSYLWIFVRGS